jgi:hypothetical protein
VAALEDRAQRAASISGGASIRKRILKLQGAVTTSAERFDRNGILRQQIMNAWSLLRFRLGATPQSLAAAYERRRLRL